ncbi:MAG: YbaK/EbsC family protein [Chloroflexi bacterium]|nr:YbaK/EbsC family protein [Chloroflexota bacterium]MBT3670124.1 YbaK/EbsC family protein [Chloroflexota bacterium]MBT4003969.1 YbaK/EbsC family protein [Chloroflexota bacterium]MBT4306674.1 YbaK/EbsC family protein [Chloroflexota bacterium]MBT4533010.1 YbaK/EbsC family protein [Chloroflexota bacterium]
MTKLKPLGVKDLEAYLKQEGIPGEILILDSPTPTVETAAKALGIEPDQIVKSILFMINEEPVLALGCGLDLIDRRLVGKYFEVGRKKVKMADADGVLKYGGYPIGTVPPIGHRQLIPTLMDEKILRHEVVYVGGGAHNAMLRMKAKDVLQFSNAVVLDLSTPKNMSKGK